MLEASSFEHLKPYEKFFRTLQIKFKNYGEFRNLLELEFCGWFGSSYQLFRNFSARRFLSHSKRRKWRINKYFTFLWTRFFFFENFGVVSRSYQSAFQRIFIWFFINLPRAFKKKNRNRLENFIQTLREFLVNNR